MKRASDNEESNDGSGSQTARTALAAAWAASVLFLIFVIAVARSVDRPLGDFTRDPTAVLDGPAYIGVVSSMGAAVWAIAVGACLLAALVLGWPRSGPFLFGGLLTLLLLADDLLLLHEAYYEIARVPENGYPLIYGLAFIAYVWVYRAALRRNGWMLASAVILFVISAAIDLILDDDAPFIVEDGAKFLGIVTWTVFFVTAAAGSLEARTLREEDRQDR